jgi:predicted enzyme related to lactoylglutathione lyase
LIIGLAGPGSWPARAAETPLHEFGITANNFMFYHEDLEAAAKFYEEVIGLRKVLDYGTAKMYRLAGTSYITLVRGRSDRHNLGPSKPVTVSLITDDLQAWHSHLTGQGVPIEHEQLSSDGLAQNSFVALDPAGYFLQFLRFNKHEQNEVVLRALNESEPIYANPGVNGTAGPTLGIRATVTSFYYRNLGAAQDFYEQELGFELATDQGIARIYRTSPTGYFRLAGPAGGLHAPTDDIGQKKGVMLSLYTDNVDAWFDFIVDRDEVVMRTPEMVDIENLREFSFNDTGQYSVELNFFKDTHANRQLRELLYP